MLFRNLMVITAALLSIGRVAHASQQRHPVPCGSGPEVAGVRSVSNDPNQPPSEAYLGDSIEIWVCHFDVFRDEAAKAQEPITLYVDGLDTGLTPTAINADAGSLTFTLDRTQKNKDLWKPWLYNPLFEPTEELFVSVGRGGERPLTRVPGANMRLTLRKIYVDWTVGVSLLGLVIIIVVFMLYTRKTDLLRDGPAIGEKQQIYSLARTQMAWWFLLTVVGFVFIWIVTGDHDTIPASLLGLMGISAATALTAVAVTPSSAKRIAALRARLDEEQAAIDEALLRIDTAIRALDDRMRGAAGSEAELLTRRKAALAKTRSEHEEERANIVLQSASITTVFPSHGLWRDLVTDDHGAIALDRFQIVVWTCVLGGVFLYSVVWWLTMPEFNTTLLTLMGISSGTYIGFKLPQKMG